MLLLFKVLFHPQCILLTLTNFSDRDGYYHSVTGINRIDIDVNNVGTK